MKQWMEYAMDTFFWGMGYRIIQWKAEKAGEQQERSAFCLSGIGLWTENAES